jgi:hypothetical protein
MAWRLALLVMVHNCGVGTAMKYNDLLTENLALDYSGMNHVRKSSDLKSFGIKDKVLWFLKNLFTTCGGGIVEIGAESVNVAEEIFHLLNATGDGAMQILMSAAGAALSSRIGDVVLACKDIKFPIIGKDAFSCKKHHGKLIGLMVLHVLEVTQQFAGSVLLLERVDECGPLYFDPKGNGEKYEKKAKEKYLGLLFGHAIGMVPMVVGALRESWEKFSHEYKAFQGDDNTYCAFFDGPNTAVEWITTWVRKMLVLQTGESCQVAALLMANTLTKLFMFACKYDMECNSAPSGGEHAGHHGGDLELNEAASDDPDKEAPDDPNTAASDDGPKDELDGPVVPDEAVPVVPSA